MVVHSADCLADSKAATTVVATAATMVVRRVSTMAAGSATEMAACLAGPTAVHSAHSKVVDWAVATGALMAGH